MADWRFPLRLIAGPNAGTVLGELPLSDTQIIDRLKGAGNLSAQMPLDEPEAAWFLQPPGALDSPSLVHQAMLFAERDKRIMFAGRFQPAGDIDLSQGSFPVSFEGAWSLVRDRHIRNTQGMSFATLAAGEVRFDQRDQFRIVSDLINHMQSINGGNLGITVNMATGLTGVLRDRSYEADKGKSIGEAIEQLANVEDGFDWGLDPGGTPENPTLTLNLHYPRRGRETTFVFAKDENGSGNVLNAKIAPSPGPATRFVAVGPGEGSSQLVRRSADASLINKVPLVEQSGSWLDVTRGPTLMAHARRNLSIAGPRGDVPVLTVDPNAEPRLSTYIVGDIVQVDLRTKAPPGRFPIRVPVSVSGESVTVDGDPVTVRSVKSVDRGGLSLSGRYRITARTINIGGDGAETVDLELAALGRFL
jgi:hypothetical protein